MELQQFMNFLKKNNCYEQFVKDFKKYPTKWRLNRHFLSIEDVERIFLIDKHNIIWHSLTFYPRHILPKEKLVFWYKIDKLWCSAFISDEKK